MIIALHYWSATVLICAGNHRQKERRLNLTQLRKYGARPASPLNTGSSTLTWPLRYMYRNVTEIIAISTPVLNSPYKFRTSQSSSLFPAYFINGTSAAFEISWSKNLAYTLMSHPRISFLHRDDVTVHKVIMIYLIPHSKLNNIIYHRPAKLCKQQGNRLFNTHSLYVSFLKCHS